MQCLAESGRLEVWGGGTRDSRNVIQNSCINQKLGRRRRPFNDIHNFWILARSVRRTLGIGRRGQHAMLRLVEMPGKAQRITKSEQGRGGIYIWAARSLANNVTGFILNVTLPLKVESWPGLGCDQWNGKLKAKAFAPVKQWANVWSSSLQKLFVSSCQDVSLLFSFLSQNSKQANIYWSCWKSQNFT